MAKVSEKEAVSLYLKLKDVSKQQEVIVGSTNKWLRMVNDIKEAHEHLNNTIAKERSVAREMLRDKRKRKTLDNELKKIAIERVKEERKRLKFSVEHFPEQIKYSKVLRQEIKDEYETLKKKTQEELKAANRRRDDLTLLEKIADVYDDILERIRNSKMAAVGITAISMAWRGLKTVFMETFRYLQDKLYPMLSMMNKEIGFLGGTKLKGQAEGMAIMFERLGLGFQQGAEHVTKFAKGLESTKLSNKEINLGVKMAELLGMNAEEAGKMALSFKKSGVSLDVLDKGFVEAAQGADSFGIPIQNVLKDITNAPEVLARFGAANFEQFNRSAIHARRYGMSIKDVNQSFGESMDTFDKTSDVASKLNAVFGTQINSLKLMMETDPTKRLEMVRKELVKRKRTYDSLSVSEQNVLSQQLQLSKSQLQLMLGSKAQQAQARKAEEQKKRDIQINEWWQRGVLNAKRTLMEWGAEIGVLYRSISNVIAKMFGWENAMDATTGGVNTIKEVIRTLAKLFDNIHKKIETGALFNLKEFLKEPGEGLRDFGKYLRDGKGFVDDLLESIKNLKVAWNLLTLDFKEAGEASGFFKEEENIQYKNALSRIIEGYKKRGQSVPKGIMKEYMANDALITKKGEIVRFNPNDNIMAFQNKMPGTESNTELKAEIAALRQAVSELSSAAKNNGVKVETADINIDGRKVGEAQIRIARVGI